MATVAEKFDPILDTLKASTLKSVKAINAYMKEATQEFTRADFQKLSRIIKKEIESGSIKTLKGVLTEYNSERLDQDGNRIQQDPKPPIHAALAFCWSRISDFDNEKIRTKAKLKADREAEGIEAREQKILDVLELHEMCVEFLNSPISDKDAWAKKVIACSYFTGRRIIEVIQFTTFTPAGMYLMKVSGIAKKKSKTVSAVIPVLYESRKIKQALDEIAQYLSLNRAEALRAYDEAMAQGENANKILSDTIRKSVSRIHDDSSRKILLDCAEEDSESKESLHGLRRAYTAVMLEARGHALTKREAEEKKLKFVQDCLLHEKVETSTKYMIFIAERVQELVKKLGTPFAYDLEYGVKRSSPVLKRSFLTGVFLGNLDDANRLEMESILENTEPDSGRFELELARKVNVASLKTVERVEKKKEEKIKRKSGEERVKIIVDCLMQWNEVNSSSKQLFISNGIIRKISARHSTQIFAGTVNTVLQEMKQSLDEHHQNVGLTEDSNIGLRGRMDEILTEFIEKYADRL